MRAITDDKSFKPIHIVLETPEEVAKFYAMLEVLPLLCALNIEAKASDLRKFLTEQVPETTEKFPIYWDKIQHHLKQSYGKFRK